VIDETAPADPEQVWARRLERERSARRQAERTAERGMRELWSANQQLETRVAERTEALERRMCFGERVARERLVAMSSVELGGEGASLLAHLIDMTPESSQVGASAGWTVSQMARELIERWQHRAARVGLLLVVEGASDDDTTITTGALELLVAADALIAAAASSGRGGALTVSIASSPVASITLGRADPGQSRTDGAPSPHPSGLSPIDAAHLIIEQLPGVEATISSDGCAFDAVVRLCLDPD
jgi:hypothetical protein